jgi:hypothetical protein
MRIEMLSFDGCPNRDVALERLLAALETECLTAEVTEVLVTDPAAAEALRFLGSPTVRINGIDVAPFARALDRFGFMCRTYQTEHGTEGAPSLETIRAALRTS